VTVTPAPADVAGAMRTLLARRAAALAGGAVALGWKVGINAPALQEHFGLTGPIVGYLTDATELAVGQPVAVDGWRQPMLEVELAIRVGPGGGIAALAPALEMVDLDLPFDRIEPILAANIFHRGVLFGADVVGASVDELTVVVTRAGEELARGGVTEDPEVSVAAVRSFLETHGAVLRPGERIIAGSLFAPLAVAPGDHLEVSYGSFGSFNVEFSAKGAAGR
jgi:2-keto-4-pentenoate hydratase